MRKYFFCILEKILNRFKTFWSVYRELLKNFVANFKGTPRKLVVQFLSTFWLLFIILATLPLAFPSISSFMDRRFTSLLPLPYRNNFLKHKQTMKQTSNSRSCRASICHLTIHLPKFQKRKVFFFYCWEIFFCTSIRRNSVYLRNRRKKKLMGKINKASSCMQNEFEMIVSVRRCRTRRKTLERSWGAFADIEAASKRRKSGARWTAQQRTASVTVLLKFMIIGIEETEKLLRDPQRKFTISV